MRVRTGGHGAGKSGFVLPYVAASPGRRPGSPARRAVAGPAGRSRSRTRFECAESGDSSTTCSRAREPSLCLRERLYRVESSNNSSATPALSPFACSTACSRRTAPPPAAPPQSSVTPSRSPVVPRSARPASTSRRSRSWRLTPRAREAHLQPGRTRPRARLPDAPTVEPQTAMRGSTRSFTGRRLPARRPPTDRPPPQVRIAALLCMSWTVETTSAPAVRPAARRGDFRPRCRPRARVPASQRPTVCILPARPNQIRGRKHQEEVL